MKIALVSLLLAFSLEVLATPGQTFLLDRAVNQKLRSIEAGPWAAEAKLAQLEARVRALESRLAKVSSERKTRLDQISQVEAVLASQHVLLDPYTNPTWLEKAKTVANRFCCRLKSDPKMADAAVDNIQSGKRPIEGFKEKFPVSE